jgi:hypothetical protein
LNYKNRILIYLNSNSKIQNPISRCYPLVRDRLNEFSTESRRDDESGHDDSARVLDEVAEISFTMPPTHCWLISILYFGTKFHGSDSQSRKLVNSLITILEMQQNGLNLKNSSYVWNHLNKWENVKLVPVVSLNYK